VFEIVGDYDTSTFLAEDYDYWVRVGKKFEIAHLAGVAPYAYLRHGNSLSDVLRPEVEIQNARVQAKHTESVLKRRQYLGNGHFHAAYAYRQKSSFGPALKHSFMALAYQPFTMRSYRSFVGLGRDVLKSALK
jgi:hypothetical protein